MKNFAKYINQFNIKHHILCITQNLFQNINSNYKLKIIHNLSKNKYPINNKFLNMILSLINKYS